MSFPNPSEFIAIVQQWTPEQRAAVAAALSPAVASKKASAPKSAAAAPERPSVDLSERPEMPEDPELDEDCCHARVPKLLKSDESAAAIFRQEEEEAGRPVKPSEKSFYLSGFKSKIYVGAQCDKKVSGSKILCPTCAGRKVKYEESGSKGHGPWYGVIGEEPPADAHLVGSEWSNNVYETQFGVTPSSGGRSPKAKAEPKAKAKEEPKKEPKAKKEAKKEAPSNAAAVAPPPVAAEKKPAPVISDELVYNLHCDCFINPEGVCYYADMDEQMKPIPAMDKIIGSIPKKGGKPLTLEEREEAEEYTEADEAEEAEEA
jgi:hypothetical protein